jgi:hypothetical protein
MPNHPRDDSILFLSRADSNGNEEEKECKGKGDGETLVRHLLLLHAKLRSWAMNKSGTLLRSEALADMLDARSLRPLFRQSQRVDLE